MRQMRRAARLLAALLLLAAVAAGLWRALDWELDQPAAASAPVRLQVAPGSSLRSTLLMLQQQGALRHARLVELYLRLHGPTPRLQSGNYEVAPHSSAREVLNQLISGRVVLESLTVVEGWSFAQMRSALDAHPAVAHQWRELTAAQLMEALGHAGEPAEGRFFPDTYRFAAGTSDRRILERAYERMQSELDSAWGSRAPDLPLASPEQALILASIVEKETGREDERPKVAVGSDRDLRAGRKLRWAYPYPRPGDRYALQHLHPQRHAADPDRVAGRRVAAGDAASGRHRCAVLRCHRQR